MNGILASRYEITRRIGHGGMGDVYEAIDTRLKRIVAIKVLRADLADNPTLIERFQKEAHATAQLNNPFIVATYDAGEDSIVNSDGTSQFVSYMVMECVQGETLKAILKERGKIGYGEACRIMEGVLTALDYSHKSGIVHRDIKPGNIMITRAGQVKVMDFGIARALSDAAHSDAESKSVLGTAQYLSPEQAKGEFVDARSDLYSAACVFYEMLTGRPPFTGDSPVSVAYQHVSETPILPSKINPALPVIIDKVLMKALQKNKENRYQKAVSFRSDIQIMLAQLNDNSRYSSEGVTEVLSPVDPAAIASSSAIGANEKAPSDQSNKKKKIIIISVISGLVLLIALVLLYLLFLNGTNGDLDKSASPSPSPSETPTKTVSASPTLGEVVIQDTKNFSQEKVRQILEDAKLEVGDIKSENSADVEKDKVIRTDPKSGTPVPVGSVITIYISTGQVDLPDVTEKSKSDAKSTLNELGLIVKFTEAETEDFEAGTVMSQSPETGSVPQGSTVTLTIAKAPATATIPADIVGMDQTAAQSALESLGLSVVVQNQPSETVALGLVVSCTPGANSEVELNSSVTLVVSSGPEPKPEPSS